MHNENALAKHVLCLTFCVVIGDEVCCAALSEQVYRCPGGEEPLKMACTKTDLTVVA